jgi:hypothetical protein
LLAALKPGARRALRSFVHQVEFGQLRVMEWLAAPTCPVKERRWRYLLADEAFKRALAAYKAALQRWQLADEQRAVAGSQRTLRLATGQAAGRLVEQVEGNLGQFFKVVERWTDEPLPSQAIVRDETRGDEEGIERKFYLVRQVVFDVESLADPRRARQIRKFTDSPRTGLSIELYDAQDAAESILDRADAETASKAAGQGGGVVVVIPDNGRADRPATGATDEVPGQSG